MTIQFENTASVEFRGLIEGLLSIDREHKEVISNTEVIPHFIHIQSLIRCCIEYCEVAFKEADLGHIFPANALVRCAFDHVVLGSFLYKKPNGAETTLLILDKNNREWGEKARSAGAKDAAELLLETLTTDPAENGKITTKTGALIKEFVEYPLLDHFYFLLGQSVHPKAAFSQYIEIDVSTGNRQIRRRSKDQDPTLTYGFIFQVLAIALFLDADSRNDVNLRSNVLKIADRHVFGPELTIGSVPPATV